MEDHGLRPGGSWVKASPRQIVHETHGLKSAWAKSYQQDSISINKAGMVAHPMIPAMWEHRQVDHGPEEEYLHLGPDKRERERGRWRWRGEERKIETPSRTHCAHWGLTVPIKGMPLKACLLKVHSTPHSPPPQALTNGPLRDTVHIQTVTVAIGSLGFE